MRTLAYCFVACMVVATARGQEGEKKEGPAPAEAKSASTDQLPKAEDSAEKANQQEAELSPSIPPPEWLKDMSWYYIDVPRFRNGDTSNDPPGTLPWGAKGATVDTRFGGDLQGVREKLGYLKTLGVNGLILANVLHETADRQSLAMTIHVDPAVSISERDNKNQESEDINDVRSWTLTAGDEFLMELIKDARNIGMRVVLGAPDSHGFSLDGVSSLSHRNQSLKWIDPINDPTPNTKIDGWLHWRPVNSGLAGSEIVELRTQMAKVNSQAALIALDAGGTNLDATVQSGYDSILHTHGGDAAVQFFSLSNSQYGLQELSKRIQSKEFHALHTSRLSFDWARQLLDPFLMMALVDESGYAKDIYEGALGDSQGTKEKFFGRWRLYMTLRYFAREAPVVHFGDEIGLCYRESDFRPVMWWTDLPNPEAKPEHYRGDFYALIQMLNTFRARFAPLRRGDFKPLIADDDKKLFAFARTLPGDEIILVMNYSDAKQSAKLTVGRPGELVQVLSPQLKPMPMVRKGQPSPPEPDLTKIPELRVGGQREYVKPDGTIDFWVDPMAVRIVVLGESALAKPK